MLVEASIQDLITSTDQIETKARQHIANQVQFSNGFQSIKVGPDIVFQGDTSTGHHPKIRITGIKEDDGPTSVEIMTMSGKPLNILPLTKQTQCYVTCDCEDFVYRFATTNQQRGVLFGKITRPHIPKSNRMTSNLGVIGFCKHLIKFTELLTAERILK